MPENEAPHPPLLPRQVGVVQAVLLGLGSMVGTGVFVSLGLGAAAIGPAVVLALLLAALLAAANALSSAQLAANHPVSGGTYEYGYQYLHPALGFTAGWMFLCAKSASSATAALGLASYLLAIFKMDETAEAWRVPLALGLVVLLTLLVLAGVRRSSQVNAVIVSVTLLTLGLLVVIGIPTATAQGSANFTPFFSQSGSTGWAKFLEACALMFVAYTGYGRIATLGEEITEPRRNIPRAIVVALLVAWVVYAGVAMVAIGSVGAEELATATLSGEAPLQRVAAVIGGPWLSYVMTVGAVTAMTGVLLNLILGLSRVALAMARRGDLPRGVASLDKSGSNPWAAVILVACFIAGLVLIGSVKLTWSFSAFTVLVYYALTNASALRLSPKDRLYPSLISWLGLAGCLVLAFWVDLEIWLIGLALIAAGLLWHVIAQRLSRSRTP